MKTNKTTPEPYDALLARVKNRQATIGILGMGYVGFPLALAAHKAGYEVLGFDIDPTKVEKLNHGVSYIKTIPDAKLKEMLGAGRFRATANAADLAAADALILCVPTPLTKNREPDMSFVEATCRTVAGVLRRGQLVSLESTTYPGTTAELMAPILNESGLRAGEDFYIAYSPEREDPGNAQFHTASIPKVVGADDARSLALAEALYSNIVSRVVTVKSAATAEAVKLTENIFRSVNIALVNELKMVFEKMGIDIWEVVEAAKTKPFGYMPFYPGPGVGGHCIPIDPFYLTWKSREFNMPTRFIELAGQVNERMPDYVVLRLREALDKHSRKGLNGARLLLLGVAYKKDVDDPRESPSVFLMEKLLAAGAQVDFHDPMIPVFPPTRDHAPLAGRNSLPLEASMLAGYDAVIIGTDHSAADYALVAKHARLIVDTRNTLGRLGLSATGPIVKA